MNMDFLTKKIANDIKNPLSDADIKKALNGKIKILGYSEINENGTLEEFFGPYNMVSLLYRDQHESGVGHWTLISRLNGTTVEFFCPYGFIADSKKELLQGNFPKLTYLLYNCGIENVIFNSSRLQKMDGDISTCGRWLILRARTICLPLETFVSRVKKNKLTDIFDLFCLFLTSDV